MQIVMEDNEVTARQQAGTEMTRYWTGIGLVSTCSRILHIKALTSTIGLSTAHGCYWYIQYAGGHSAGIVLQVVDFYYFLDCDHASRYSRCRI